MSDKTGILSGAVGAVAPSTTFKNRLGRFLWCSVWFVLCRFSPRPFHAWRSLILRAFGAKIGAGVHVYPDVHIWAPWNLEMDDYSCLANGVTCYSMAKVVIGKKVVISQGVHLCTGTHDYSSHNFQLCAFPISIGDQVWICSDSFIAPGVSIGDGVVIGAASVVTKSMPPWMVCAGNPCRPLKPRVIRR